MTDCPNLTRAEVAILAAIRPFIGHSITTELCEELLTAILSVGRPHIRGQSRIEVRFADAAPSTGPHVAPAADSDSLHLAVAAVLKADAEFRSNMPKDWGGDPLSDELDGLRRIFEAMPAPPPKEIV